VEAKKRLFQSPFSGASLSYTLWFNIHTKDGGAFNLHFQEPPFLTEEIKKVKEEVQKIFQSPFSGASLSYSLYPSCNINSLNSFQSPFSGASLSYTSGKYHKAGLEAAFQSPFSGASLSYSD